MSLERRFFASPAYDFRAKNGGIHGVDLQFAVVGEFGTVSFLVFTGWFLPGIVQPPHIAEMYPMAAGLDFHRATPWYDDQPAASEDCAYTGGKCYVSGSVTGSEPLMELLIRGGSDAVWLELERLYAEEFGGTE